MNKSQLIERMALQADLSKASATRALDAALAAITETLVRGEPVALVGFGSFEVATRAARNGRDPRNGAEIRIASSAVARFRPGKSLKEALNR